MTSQKLCAIIPERDCLKGVARRNITVLGSYPVIPCALLAAKLCPEIDRVIASANSCQPADMGRLLGAYMLDLRSPELAQVPSHAIQSIFRAVDWLQSHERLQAGDSIQLDAISSAAASDDQGPEVVSRHSWRLALGRAGDSLVPSHDNV